MLSAVVVTRVVVNTQAVAQMLARDNRVRTADDFRTIVRRGRRSTTAHFVVYVSDISAGEPSRFGFIITKAVGGAVQRNLVRRRLRSIGHDILDRAATGSAVVVRVLPGAVETPWNALHSEIFQAVGKSVAAR